MDSKLTKRRNQREGPEKRGRLRGTKLTARGLRKYGNKEGKQLPPSTLRSLWFHIRNNKKA